MIRRLTLISSGGSKSSQITIGARSRLLGVDWAASFLTSSFTSSQITFAELSTSSAHQDQVNDASNVISGVRSIFNGAAGTTNVAWDWAVNKSVRIEGGFELEKGQILYLHSVIGAFCNARIDVYLYIVEYQLDNTPALPPEDEPRGSVKLSALAESPSPNSKDVQALAKKVINARDAYICCETNKNRLYGAINGTLIGLFNALESWGSGQVMALVPGPVATPWLVRIITIAETSAAAAATLGSLVIIGGAALIGSLAAAKAAYDMLGLVGTAIGTMVATADPGCFNCVREKTLSQKHPRKRLHDQNILKRL